MIRGLVEEVLLSETWEWFPSAAWTTAARMEDVCKWNFFLFWSGFGFSPAWTATVRPGPFSTACVTRLAMPSA